MCETENSGSVMVSFGLVIRMPVKIHRLLSAFVFPLSISESLSRNAGCDIECMLLGILKRLRSSSRRIIWREMIQWKLSICLDIYLS